MTYRLYNAETLNRYAKDCHQRSVAKGFWDEQHTVGHSLMLAFGELHEAIEADRGEVGECVMRKFDNFPTLEEVKATAEAHRLDFICRLLGIND